MFPKVLNHGAFIIAWVLLGQTTVWSDSPPAVSGKPWKDSAEASLVTTNGNSKTSTTSAKNSFGYQWTKTTLDLVGEALGSSNGGSVTAERYKAGQKVTWTYYGKNYVYQNFSWDKDRFAGIQDRYEVSAGVGRRLIDSAINQWNLEVGPGYVNEQRVDAPRNDFASGRAFSKYVHNFNPTTSFSQTGEFIANAKDVNGFRINTETALVTAISTHLSFKSSFVWRRVNAPPPATVKNDTTTAVALIITY